MSSVSTFEPIFVARGIKYAIRPCPKARAAICFPGTLVFQMGCWKEGGMGAEEMIN